MPTPRPRLPGLTKSTGLIAHPFDLSHGVRTSGLVAGRHLDSRHATAYYAVAPSVFHALLRRWRKTRHVAPITETTFIDIGAGMGRAVLLASELPFSRALGVELHPALVRIARRNLTLWRRAGRALVPTRILHADAVHMNFPSTPTVLFLFNPFGPVVFRRLLRTLSRSCRAHAYTGRSSAANPAPLDLLYVNNEQESVLETQPGFTRLWRGPIRRSSADAVADRRILLSQPDAEYAAPPHEDCSIWRWTGK